MNDICILVGSPRKNGNTIQLIKPFSEELKKQGYNIQLHWLYNMLLLPCKACRTCQVDWSIFGCPQKDDMQEIFDAILNCSLLVLATPIYSWYCTPPMKAVLDRMVYGMNKYYGTAKGPALWSGKKVALITTCGYPIEKGTDIFEEGIRRYCKHSRLQYLGMLSEWHMGYESKFMDEQKLMRAKEFAHQLCEWMEDR